MMKPLLFAGFLAASAALLAGCGGDAQSSSEGTSSAVDYQAEAERSIDAENVDSVLSQLEEEIAADDAAITP